MKKIYCSILMLGFLFSFMIAQETKSTHSNNKNLYTVISSDPDLSEFLKLLKETSLADSLKTTSKHYTILAPVNSAILNMTVKKKEFLYGDETKKNLSLSLLSHFIKYDHDLTEFQTIPNGTEMKNLAFGKNIIYNNHGIVYIHDAKIITSNIKASNGTIHKIDKFILYKNKFD